MGNSQTALDCAVGATTDATADMNVRKTVVFHQKNYLSGTPKKVPKLSSTTNHLLYFLH